MPSGGARNRSGPQADPTSGRSERLGVKLTALPSSGYRGRKPRWPLPPRQVMRWVVEDGSKFQVVDEPGTEALEARERQVWLWAWKQPQAAAWALPSESWRLFTIAMWVRTYVLCEGPDATAADKGALHRFADQIGLTPAGLKENGWQISADEVGERRAERQSTDSSSEGKPKRRLRAAP